VALILHLRCSLSVHLLHLVVVVGCSLVGLLRSKMRGELLHKVRKDNGSATAVRPGWYGTSMVSDFG